MNVHTCILCKVLTDICKCNYAGSVTYIASISIETKSIRSPRSEANKMPCTGCVCVNANNVNITFKNRIAKSIVKFTFRGVQSC